MDNSTRCRVGRRVRGRTLVQPMTRESAEVKGRRYLTDGRLVVDLAHLGYFRATVRGGGQIYVVTFGRGGWCNYLSLCQIATVLPSCS